MTSEQEINANTEEELLAQIQDLLKPKQEIETDMENLQKVILELSKEYLPKEPEPKDLLPFLFHRMRTKRLRKKFLKNHMYYINNELLPLEICAEWRRKLYNKLAKVLSEVIYDTISRESFCRKILVCEPIENPES